jgi:sterol desaturase/sphingolipid hydroxylase (fatty acid hydroxylase superfamily)
MDDEAFILGPFWTWCLDNAPKIFQYPLIQHLTVIAIFYAVALPVAIADACQWTRRVQTPARQRGPVLTWGNVRQCLTGSLSNQLYVLMFLAIIHATTGLSQILPKVPPSIVESVITLAVLFLAFDVGFYILHRMLHTPWLYNNIHKRHHAFVFPFSLVAFYMHPLELILSTLCITMPVIVLNPHPLLAFLFAVGVALEGCFGHSGYTNIASSRHYLHHLKRNYNYAVFFPWIDKICGTFMDPREMNQISEYKTSKMEKDIRDETIVNMHDE